MSIINPKKLERLLNDIPDLDPEIRKQVEEANKSPRPKRWGWGHRSPTPKIVKVDPL